MFKKALSLILFLFCALYFISAQVNEFQCSRIDSLFLKCDHTINRVALWRSFKMVRSSIKKVTAWPIWKEGWSFSLIPFFMRVRFRSSLSPVAHFYCQRGVSWIWARAVQKYLPDFPEYTHPITVQHLIYHTSGIKDYFELMETAGINYLNQIERDEVYALIKSQDSLNFNPGDQYSYSNSGYLMLGMIIEKVSGMPFSRFVEQEIFKPLGMVHSMFLDNVNTMVPNRAWGYHINVDDQVENMIMRFDLVGSGGLYTTVEDLFLWDQNFYHSKIGSNRFIEKLLTTGKLNNQTRY